LDSKIEKNIGKRQFVNEELKKQGRIVLRFSEKKSKTIPSLP
jgi:hypothetical protein